MNPRRLATLAVAFSVFIACGVISTQAGGGASDVQPVSTATARAKHPTIHRVAHRYRRHRRRRITARRRTIRRTTTRRRSTVRHAASRRVVHHYRRRTVHHYRRVSYSTSSHRLHYRHAIYHRYIPWSPWRVSSYGDPSAGDLLAGGNPVVREAAIKALGRWNGTIVVADPNTGRIETIVNQTLALKRGYIPCSTVKPMVALAGLREGVITMSTRLPGMYGRRVDLTEALARSDNRYFAQVGDRLGFSRVERYARELGYGEKASLDIPDESAGVFPSAPPPASVGGVGRLTSFGTGIEQTPLQMAALVSAIANGGTLYWLQLPRTEEEAANFQPKIRRVLSNLEPYIPEVKQGMAAAVLYGTARSAYNPNEDIFGKTGTCSEDAGRMGWFISYSESLHPKYVIVVMLRGGRPMFGPHAAEIAGDLYRALLPGIESAQAQPTILPHFGGPAGE